MASHDAEVRALRQSLSSAMTRCGLDASSHLDDEVFAGRLRRCLMTLSGADQPIGFNYAAVRTPAGDFAVTLAYQEEDGSNNYAPVIVHGPTENVAFLRAAAQVLGNDRYRRLLAKRSG